MSFTINLDEAFDFYECRKRNEYNNFSVIYDKEKKIFCKRTNKANDYIVFVDSNKLCLEIIEMYLDLPHILKYKHDCKNAMKESKNKVVAFLWFFEHIDGCYDFENFEISIVTKKFIEWCKANDLEYILPEVYVQSSSRGNIY